MNLDRLALGSYFSECLEQYAGEEQPEPELMQLGLNCLYALSEGLYSPEKIKAAFELRLMTEEGYAPAGDFCAVCGRSEIREPVFALEDGQVVCRSCRKAGRTLPLSENALAALRYLVRAPAKKLLSFRLGDEDLHLLADAAENWLLQCSGRSFSTLTYYKNLIRNL